MKDDFFDEPLNFPSQSTPARRPPFQTLHKKTSKLKGSIQFYKEILTAPLA